MDVTQQALIDNLVKIFQTEISKKIKNKFKMCKNGKLGRKSRWILLKNFSSALFRSLFQSSDYLSTFPLYSSTLSQFHSFLRPLMSLQDFRWIIDEHSAAECPIPLECMHREEIQISLPCRIHFSPERRASILFLC